MSAGDKRPPVGDAPVAKRAAFAAASAPAVQMGVPGFTRPEHQVGDAHIMQPVMRLRPKAPTRGPLPSHFDALVEQRAQALSAMPQVAPRTQALTEFRKFSGTSKEVRQQAADTFGGLGGGNQGGLFPKDDTHRSERLPTHVDYTEHRPAQMLSQLSEVMFHGARRAGVNPVEIQFGYGIKDGELSVFASANKPATQTWLSEALSQPAGTHLRNAALAEDHETRLIGAKLLFHDEQTERRKAAIQDSPNQAALEADMDLAGAIRAKFLSRDVTVIENPYQRHAEQNIGVAMHLGGTQFADIQGTKIRCHGCAAGLGSNLQDPHGAYLTGKVYSSQASPQSFANSFEMVGDHLEHVATQQPQRPRADSDPHLPSVKAPGD